MKQKTIIKAQKGQIKKYSSNKKIRSIKIIKRRNHNVLSFPLSGRV